MTLTANQLISDAYYVSNIVSREFETPTGQQLSDGLRFLNELITDKDIDSSLVPYTSVYNFSAVIGQQMYFIPNLIYAETFTFYIDTIRYQTRNQQRKDYFGSFRATNIESLPFNWHTERCLNGSNLFLYFLPSQEFPLEIWGQFRLSTVTQFQNLSLTYEAFYTNFLKYELAVRLCKEYGYNAPPLVSEQLANYYTIINAKSNTYDLKQQKLSTLTSGSAINYAIVNLSGGWVPM